MRNSNKEFSFDGCANRVGLVVIGVVVIGNLIGQLIMHTRETLSVLGIGVLIILTIGYLYKYRQVILSYLFIAILWIAFVIYCIMLLVEIGFRVSK